MRGRCTHPAPRPKVSVNFDPCIYLISEMGVGFCTDICAPCACTAVMATVFTISSTRQPRLRSLTGLFSPLKYRADGNGTRGSLHRLIGVVACIEIRKNKDSGLSCHLAVWKFCFGHIGLNGGIILDGSFHEQVG